MNFILDIQKGDYGTNIMETKGFMETLGFGARMLLLGMLTVFAVLTIIWGALILFKYFFHDIPAKKNVKSVEKVETVETPVSDIPVSDDGEIIAVIAAAIAMAESESTGTKFRVVSFRRK